METIPKERLQRIGIQDDISVTIKPSNIIIRFAAYGYIAVAAAAARGFAGLCAAIIGLS
jgi:hypothetical protein